MRADAAAADIELGPVKISAPTLTEAYWVVDGQQRITALAASLLPSPTTGTDPRFELWFDLLSENFGRGGRTDSETRVPVRHAYDLSQVLTWLRARDLPDELQSRAFKLADRLRNYEVPAYLVTTDDEAALQDIFDRTNTFGRSLTRAEVFRALNTSASKPAAGVDRLAIDIEAQGFGRLKGNTLLYAVLSTRGPDVLRDFRTEFDSPEDLVHALDNTKAAIVRAASFLRLEADVLHFDLVPYQHQLVGLVRFFALHAEPESHIRGLLRRWFWQAAELGPLSKLGTTGTLRQTTKAIVADDAFGSISALLALTEGSPADPDLTSYRWNSASTRIAVSALAQLRPVDPALGEEIDVTDAIERLGRDALAPLVDPRSSELGSSVANRVFHAPDDQLSDSELTDVLQEAPDDVLQSLALTQSVASLLASGQHDRLLAERAELISSQI